MYSGTYADIVADIRQQIAAQTQEAFPPQETTDDEEAQSLPPPPPAWAELDAVVHRRLLADFVNAAHPTMPPDDVRTIVDAIAADKSGRVDWDGGEVRSVRGLTIHPRPPHASDDRELLSFNL